MQLIFQFSCSRPFSNELPNMLQLLSCPRLKTLRIMEDKIAPMVCNLVLNIVYAFLEVAAY